MQLPKLWETALDPQQRAIRGGQRVAAVHLHLGDALKGDFAGQAADPQSEIQ